MSCSYRPPRCAGRWFNGSSLFSCWCRLCGIGLPQTQHDMMHIGTPTLHRIANEAMSEWTDDEATAYMVNHRQILAKIRHGDDWLFPFIAQYHDNNPSIEDTSWYAHIKQMVHAGTLYMVMYPIASWAYRDCMKDENIANAKKSGLDVWPSKGNADACFSSGERPMTLVRVYMTCDQTPRDPETITIPLSGLVEFGTQSIAKTAMCLLTNVPLMRIPYDPNLPHLPPVACVLYNTKAMAV